MFVHLKKMAEQSENLSLATVDAVALTDLKELSVAIMEGSASALLDGTLAEHIPVVGMVYKLAKVGFAARERVFVSKVSRFLFQLDRIPAATRQQFVADLDTDPAYKQKVAENLLLLLDRADDVEKAEILGRVFKFYVVGSIDYNTYRRYAGIIDKSHLPDLQKLILISRVENIEEPEFSVMEMSALYSLGLSDSPQIRGAEDIASISLTALGQELHTMLIA